MKAMNNRNAPDLPGNTEKDRILAVVWDVLHAGYSIDTISDQDWVYEQIRHKVEELSIDNSEENRLKNICRILFNRCRTIGSADGEVCEICGIKEDCDKMHSI